MTHRISQPCMQIVRDYWMPYAKDKAQQFDIAMKTMQMELIRHHFPNMDNQSKRRAVKTLKLLET